MVENIIWPAYFDADLSRSEGRRVPSAMAVADPTPEEIAEAVKQVGYDATIEPDLAYPRQSRDRTGRVAVANADDAGKSDLLQAVAAYVQALRD
ncbi:MAG: signal recognition particle subunit SRP19 [Halobacteriota archaeon]|uniref:signal recognition particle subunit SRP19 n=1 Tax=Halodesulfurarchaeum sp. HSR-GB TaxID=3074077 RepID=UPI0028577E72|nr:signal recognition particle subunit SRP19 [Halodesulfurarchaeum sp. HSR-GB]MDR5657140.1 signal recognition particle subunit SRP19 [Halodesulfurarchaeum sp. HSR-GB]